MGLEAKSYTESGKLVPDSVVIGIIKERLAKDDCKNGFILDGFPRTVPQAQALDEMGIEMDVVISIEVADEAIVSRMSGRRVCSGCGASYHVAYNPASNGTHCDKCQTELSVRKDDQPDVVLDRLRVYHEQTEPLKEYYARKGKLKIVQGQEKLSETTKLTMEAIASLTGK